MQSRLKLGTRGSPLAIWQAEEVRRLLVKTGFDESAIELVIVQTSGDVIQDRPLREVGGKELFTKEIEELLLNGGIDLAVHSAKDVATILPEGLELAAFLPREDVREAFVSLKAKSLDDLPVGARIGTASLRRQAQVLARRPDLEPVLFRGNVQTRLRKLNEGLADATLLAMAGLERLGFGDHASSVLEIDHFLPAAGQGAICVETRIGSEVSSHVGALNDKQTADCVLAERAFLEALGASCRTPVAALAKIDGAKMTFRGEVYSPDGGNIYAQAAECQIGEGDVVARNAGDAIRAELPAGFIEAHF